MHFGVRLVKKKMHCGNRHNALQVLMDKLKDITSLMDK